MHVYIKHDFKFSSDKAVGAMGKVSLRRLSGFGKNSLYEMLGKEDEEFVSKMFSLAKKKIMKL